MRKILPYAFAALLTAFFCLPLGSVSTAPAGDGKVMVKLTTSKGDILLELDSAKAPLSVENFVRYVKDGYYNGLIFHRVIDGFMIQGGGLDKSMHEKSGRPAVKNEAGNGLKNEPYTVAMARTSDPDSATSQFFINVANNGMLNHVSNNPQNFGYAVFGKVVQGTEVVDAIKAVPTTIKGPYKDVPVEPVEILKAEVVSK